MQLKCPYCGEEINKLGGEVKAEGCFEKDGGYTTEELGETIEYYCVACGETLSEGIANKFFKEEK